MTETKKLYRSRTDRVFFGVCGGIAEYFDIDATLVRLVAVIVAVWGGIGVLAYIIAALVIPEGPVGKNGKKRSIDEEAEDFGKKMEAAAQKFEEKVGSKDMNDKSWVGGLILILLGFLFLVHQFVPFLDFSKTWPLFLIILGLVVIFGGKK